ncbi:MAG: hypothetical protein REI78_02985 [Pedobacter sp.]|nr:hypothetical protein [Pedobacter sp.]
MPIITEMTERLARHELARLLIAFENLNLMYMTLEDAIALKLAEEIIEDIILRKGYFLQREGTNIYLTENDRFYEN